jgi:vacuolar-type H+-ATPase subunit H
VVSVLYNAEEFRQEGILGRAMVNRAERPTGRKRLDTALIGAAAVVVLFAVVGVVSAGSFVADRVSGSSTKATATVKPATSNAVVAQDIHRAQAQATAIVKQAQSAGHSIVTSAYAKARRQANAVIATARRQAASYHAPVAAAAPAPAPIPTAVPVTGAAGTGASTGGIATGVSPAPAGSVTGVNANGTGSLSPGVGTTNGSAIAPSTSNGRAASVPNLSGVPKTWLVVGYNATFAGGSGGVGTISVVNRSGKTFSGVATVKYKTGGSSSASFSGLAPGQSLVLPLSGSPYRGGGYQIVMNGLH